MITGKPVREDPKMKSLMLSFAVMVAGAGVALADPVEGTWKTEVDDGHYAHIKMRACGDKICGVIAQAFDANGPVESENIGKLLVWDMEVQSDGSYKNGKIWQPSTDKIYKSKMELNGSSLQVAGCVGPICKKQTWTRVN
jgi:uncharacterized protein (DUF2147 family)